MAISNLQEQPLRTGANGYYINDDLIFTFEATSTTTTEKDINVKLTSVVERRGVGSFSTQSEAETVIKLYKNTEGKFSYNYKGVVKKLVQSIGYDDGTTDSNIFNNLFLLITDNSDNAQISFNKRIIIADLQVNESPITDMHLLHEEYKTVVINTTDRLLGTKIQMWRGYPFDITIDEKYITEDISIRTFTFINSVFNLISDIIFKKDRLYFINKNNINIGANIGSIQTISLNLRQNETISFLPIDGNKHYLNLIQVHPECSDEEKKKHLYIKWLNKYGAFDYWLFKKTALDDTKSKHRGITTTNNVMQTVGIDTVTTQEVYYSYLSSVHLEKLKYLARSIKVYAYLENNTFVEVIISNFTVDKNNEVRFTVTYPYNNTLI